MKFGDNLKKMRKINNISQEVLAEKVGVSRQSVSKWETGDAYPTMDNMLMLCKLFNCKINDLVHENMEDLSELDESIVMNVVKLNKEDQVKVKLVSKIIFFTANILKIASLIGAFVVVISMGALAIINSNVKVSEDTIKLFNEKVIYEKTEDGYELVQNGKTFEFNNEEAVYFEKAINIVKDNEVLKYTILIEVAFLVLVITLVLFYKAMDYLYKLFFAINKGDTPFTLENVTYIRKSAIFMIITILLPNIIGLISEAIIGEDLGIGFELVDLFYILFIFSMSYIFKYGYQIQLDSKGIMYDEELKNC